ncbi:hypothetical protein SmJEL517_g03024 [Synchytrium microbalum]|uniref:Transcription initiation factor TFIID subunit 12 domain-containing protein n=1 Tax=Synchytrium microbalum TaxID=1806994 RepID=A0A507C3V6_9FUNG|nr:uncharacterized protein SmJEL517_g03024 [Synchytrium microbalum]TPX34352.1 hypothetical protein SmJEL517_g03024 [Synchytrium microbalum]
MDKKSSYLANLLKIYQAGNLSDEQKQTQHQQLAAHQQQQIQHQQQIQQQQQMQQQSQQQEQAPTRIVKTEPVQQQYPQQYQLQLQQQQYQQQVQMQVQMHMQREQQQQQQQREQQQQMQPPISKSLQPFIPQPHPNRVPEVPADPTQLVSKQKIQYLLSQIDADMKIDDPTCEMLIEVAHEFVQEITELSSRLAHHRESDTLEVKDAAKIAERFYDIRIPGFNDDPEALNAAAPSVFDQKGRGVGAGGGKLVAAKTGKKASKRGGEKA